MPVTFSVDNVKPNIIWPKEPHGIADGLSFLRQIRTDVPSQADFLTSSYAPTYSSPLSFGESTTVIPGPMGLFDTAVTAYNQHYPLVLRPDDLWLTLLAGLSFYVNANAERMRPQFVLHQGQKALIVNRTGNRFNADWDGIIDELNEGIKENIKDTVIFDWLTPNFTTTTQADKVAAQVSVMSVMSKYFHYKIYLTCGIPTITLEGMKEDWITLRNKLDRFNLLDEELLSRWYTLLVPIFDHFIAAFDGEIDISGHWKHMVKYAPTSYVCVPGPGETTGWVGYLAPFDVDGHWRLRPSERPSCMDNEASEPCDQWTVSLHSRGWSPTLEYTAIQATVQVPLYINDHGEELDGTLVAGIMGQQWDHKEHRLGAFVGWALYTGALEHDEL
ncbi:hypothetical protein BDN72DRAFT_849806 [Pluteus cervinus]|uniref:Uncharacterized protein n=1 Tax=Pluteus cervinus TaxID=181527 RepID=A0ACD3A6Z5_9AGAR|nr:hypothetical protein BDN72DRAFT_849806 [Pluteus cervinus]